MKPSSTPATALFHTTARQRVTPLARRVAAALGIDLEGVAGSGPGGLVRRADVLMVDGGDQPAPVVAGQSDDEQAIVAGAAPPFCIAHPLDLPQIVTVAEVDLGAVECYRHSWEAEYARRRLALNNLALLAAAVAAALPVHPLLNAFWSEDGIVLRRRIHLGVWQGAYRGVISDAGDLTVRGLARALGSLRAAEGSANEATFTLVDEGVGSTLVMPPLPEAGRGAMLALGAPGRRPVVWGDRILVRPVALLALTCDARVADTAQAGAFLAEVRRRLETLTPSAL